MNADELISQIAVNKANFEHILETGKINGSLWSSMNWAINLAEKDAYNQAIDDVVANIKIIISNDYFDHRTGEWKRDDPTFNKNEILKLKK